MMSQIEWNLWGLGNKSRQTELRKILVENKIEIFGLLETKLRIDKQRTLINDFDRDWSIMTNLDESDPLNCYMTWLGCKRTQWSLWLEKIHRHLIHAKLSNVSE